MKKDTLSSFLIGLLFALGLGISGMTNPQNVLGFLNIFGEWKPNLIFVMMGAIIIHSLFYQLVKKKTSPLFNSEWHIPKRKDLTFSLLMGSIVFGIGWGLVGFCPGPALVSLATFQPKPLVFVLFMVLGMLVFEKVENKKRKK